MRSLLTLLPILPLALSQTTTVDTFGFLGANYSASVIAYASSTTTLQLVCASAVMTDSPIVTDAAGDTDYACFDSTLTVTTATNFWGAEISDGDATGSLACSLGGTTVAACTQVYTSTDDPSATAESVVTTLSAPSDYVFVPLVITAGLEKLSGGAPAATTTGESGKPAESTGTGARETPTGAAAGVFPTAGVVGAMGAIVAGLVL